MKEPDDMLFQSAFWVLLALGLSIWVLAGITVVRWFG
jgi:hypothetical protein